MAHPPSTVGDPLFPDPAALGQTGVPPSDLLHDRWINDVIRMMMIVVLVSALLISIANIAGIFTLQDTFPIYLLLILILPARWAFQHKHWRWLVIVPSGMCYFLGAYGTYKSGFTSNLALFYVLAVFLAELPQFRFSYLMVLACIATYLGLGLWVEGYTVDILADVITFSCALFGIMLLQKNASAHFQKTFRAYIDRNERLREEIGRRQQAENTVHELEAKAQSLIQSLPLGIHMYLLEEDGRLIFTGYNPAANRILGINHADLVGETLETVFPGLKDTEVPDRYRAIARYGGIWKKNQIVYSNGAVAGVYDVQAFQTSPGKMAATFADITEQIRINEALRQSEEKFSTAFHLSPDSININRLADGVYIDINQGFTQLMGYTREDVLGKSSLDLNIWGDPEDRARLVKGLQEKGEVENLEARFRRKDGTLGVGLMSARMMTVQGERCILSITRDISDRIQADIRLREAHSLLEQAYDATLKGWASVLELRERETADHSRRVVELTLKVAREMGIPDKELIAIQRGALLHDIGKMRIPDEILLKPAQLTPDEWVIMRQHPEYARVMLSQIDYLIPSIVIPYGHHERWDGSGYPEGLRGEEIPLPARIFAVIDVFDALTHDRPYRPAWPEMEALRYLQDQCEIQFDPKIVDIFLKVVQAGS